MLIIGPRHLYAALDEYLTHYGRHRPYRSRNARSPDSGGRIVTVPVTSMTDALIRRRKILGGLIRKYERAA
jgi:putative transposase